MRNKTAFIFVLLANMVLLAHAVVPHHHHSQSPVDVAMEGNHDEEHEHHEHHEKLPFCNDDHEEGETKACTLTEATLIPNNQNRLNELLEQVVTTDILFISLYVFNYSFISSGSDCPDEIIESIPIHTRFLFSSQGLRAPPVC